MTRGAAALVFALGVVALGGCASSSALQKAIGGGAGLSACIVIGTGMCQVQGAPASAAAPPLAGVPQ